jgi:hypothetical protein
MSENDTVTMNVKGLDQILKALRARAPQARVGILGSTNPRTGKQNSNATIGAAHEFGTTQIPQRSFLRVPISENLEKRLESSGALDKETIKEVIKSGTVIPWMQKITVLAEQIVLDAFSSGGFGKWPAWKNPKYKNNTGQLLLDTTQLRNSITSEVKQ